jgi:predicted heme/steroid binding protein
MKKLIKILVFIGTVGMIAQLQAAITIEVDTFASGDDTTKLEAVATYVNANAGDYIIALAGRTYLISRSINFNNGGALSLTFKGRNSIIKLSNYSSLSFGNATVFSTINMKYLSFEDNSPSALSWNPLVNIGKLSNSTFQAIHFNGKNNRRYNLAISESDSVNMQACNFCYAEVGMAIGQPGVGSSSDNNSYFSCSWHNNKHTGAAFFGLRNTTIYSCSAEWNQGIGIGIHSSADYSYNVTIKNCYILNNCGDAAYNNVSPAVAIGTPIATWTNNSATQYSIYVQANMIDGTYQRSAVAANAYGFQMENNSAVKNSSAPYHLELYGPKGGTISIRSNRDSTTGAFTYLNGQSSEVKTIALQLCKK